MKSKTSKELNHRQRHSKKNEHFSSVSNGMFPGFLFGRKECSHVVHTVARQVQGALGIQSGDLLG
jgi:hypothetical protein